jgi:hypothetical protein
LNVNYDNRRNGEIILGTVWAQFVWGRLSERDLDSEEIMHLSDARVYRALKLDGGLLDVQKHVSLVPIHSKSLQHGTSRVYARC